MQEVHRKRFQGVINIIRFNWHFYVVASIVLWFSIVFKNHIPIHLQQILPYFIYASSLMIVTSLLISFYIYDVSNLYQLSWLPNLNATKVLNVNAGFDETTKIIQYKYDKSDIVVCDFYNPKKHTELSLQRARKAYPPEKGTISISTINAPFDNQTFNYILSIFAAHEIRDTPERVAFFKELNRITTPNGKIIITEHLRDWKNFLAYTIGFFHFYSKKNWVNVFQEAGLRVEQEINHTPFVTTFILEKNGDAF